LLTFEEVTTHSRSDAASAGRDEDDERLEPLTGQLTWSKH
jgi:hypothetical protein